MGKLLYYFLLPWRSWRFRSNVVAIKLDPYLLKNSSSGQNHMYQRFITTICLMTLLGGSAGGPLFRAPGGKMHCGCPCPKPGQSCCCGRTTGAASHHGPSWSAQIRCENQCRCITAKAPRADKPLLSWRLRIDYSRAGRTILPASHLAVTYQSGYLRSLYQRPPPWM